MKKHFLPILAMGKILKKNGAKRVSLDAKHVLIHELENIAKEVSKHAVKYAEHAGRRTVQIEDIKLAIK